MQIMQQSLYHLLNEIYKRSKFLKEDFDFFLFFPRFSKILGTSISDRKRNCLEGI